MDQNSIYHHGIKGMKWGVRRYQNKDGSLTPAGKKRRGSSDFSVRIGVKRKASSSTSKKASSSKPKKKSVSEMSDDELRKAISRLQLEKQYRDLTPQKVSSGKRFVNKVMKQVVEPAVSDAGRQILRDALLSAAKGSTKKKR